MPQCPALIVRIGLVSTQERVIPPGVWGLIPRSRVSLAGLPAPQSQFSPLDSKQVDDITWVAECFLRVCALVPSAS